jgi:hypothetical protein
MYGTRAEGDVTDVVIRDDRGGKNGRMKSGRREDGRLGLRLERGWILREDGGGGEY